MKYYINNHETNGNNFYQQLEAQIKSFVICIIDNEIDKEEKPYILNGAVFKASTILKKCNPVAYNERIKEAIADGMYSAKDDLISGYEYLINSHSFIIEE